MEEAQGRRPNADGWDVEMVDRAVHAAWGRAVVEHYGSGRGVKDLEYCCGAEAEARAAESEASRVSVLALRPLSLDAALLEVDRRCSAGESAGRCAQRLLETQPTALAQSSASATVSEVVVQAGHAVASDAAAPAVRALAAAVIARLCARGATRAAIGRNSTLRGVVERAVFASAQLLRASQGASPAVARGYRSLVTLLSAVEDPTGSPPRERSLKRSMSLATALPSRALGLSREGRTPSAAGVRPAGLRASSQHGAASPSSAAGPWGDRPGARLAADSPPLGAAGGEGKEEEGASHRVWSDADAASLLSRSGRAPSRPGPPASRGTDAVGDDMRWSPPATPDSSTGPPSRRMVETAHRVRRMLRAVSAMDLSEARGEVSARQRGQLPALELQSSGPDDAVWSGGGDEAGGEWAVGPAARALEKAEQRREQDISERLHSGRLHAGTAASTARQRGRRRGRLSPEEKRQQRQQRRALREEAEDALDEGVSRLQAHKALAELRRAAEGDASKRGRADEEEDELPAFRARTFAFPALHRAAPREPASGEEEGGGPSRVLAQLQASAAAEAQQWEQKNPVPKLTRGAELPAIAQRQRMVREAEEEERQRQRRLREGRRKQLASLHSTSMPGLPAPASGGGALLAPPADQSLVSPVQRRQEEGGVAAAPDSPALAAPVGEGEEGKVGGAAGIDSPVYGAPVEKEEDEEDDLPPARVTPRALGEGALTAAARGEAVWSEALWELEQEREWDVYWREAAVPFDGAASRRHVLAGYRSRGRRRRVRTSAEEAELPVPGAEGEEDVNAPPSPRCAPEAATAAEMAQAALRGRRERRAAREDARRAVLGTSPRKTRAGPEGPRLAWREPSPSLARPASEAALPPPSRAEADMLTAGGRALSRRRAVTPHAARSRAAPRTGGGFIAPPPPQARTPRGRLGVSSALAALREQPIPEEARPRVLQQDAFLVPVSEQHRPAAQEAYTAGMRAEAGRAWLEECVAYTRMARQLARTMAIVPRGFLVAHGSRSVAKLSAAMQIMLTLYSGRVRALRCGFGRWRGEYASALVVERRKKVAVATLIKNVLLLRRRERRRSWRTWKRFVAHARWVESCRRRSCFMLARTLFGWYRRANRAHMRRRFNHLKAWWEWCHECVARKKRAARTLTAMYRRRLRRAARRCLYRLRTYGANMHAFRIQFAWRRRLLYVHHRAARRVQTAYRRHRCMALRQRRKAMFREVATQMVASWGLGVPRRQRAAETLARWWAARRPRQHLREGARRLRWAVLVLQMACRRHYRRRWFAARRIQRRYRFRLRAMLLLPGWCHVLAMRRRVAAWSQRRARGRWGRERAEEEEVAQAARHRAALRLQAAWAQRKGYFPSFCLMAALRVTQSSDEDVWERLRRRRRFRAAVAFQRLWRGYATRKRTAPRLVFRHWYPLLTGVWAASVERYKSACELQRMARGYLCRAFWDDTRAALEAHHRRRHAAKAVQRYTRGWLARCRRREARHERQRLNTAARRIQHAWLRMRRPVAPAEAALLALEVGAWAQGMRSVRGWAVRSRRGGSEEEGGDQRPATAIGRAESAGEAAWVAGGGAVAVEGLAPGSEQAWSEAGPMLLRLLVPWFTVRAPPHVAWLRMQREGALRAWVAGQWPDYGGAEREGVKRALAAPQEEAAADQTSEAETARGQQGGPRPSTAATGKAAAVSPWPVHGVRALATPPWATRVLDLGRDGRRAAARCGKVVAARMGAAGRSWAAHALVPAGLAPSTEEPRPASRAGRGLEGAEGAAKEEEGGTGTNSPPRLWSETPHVRRRLLRLGHQRRLRHLAHATAYVGTLRRGAIALQARWRGVLARAFVRRSYQQSLAEAASSVGRTTWHYALGAGTARAKRGWVIRHGAAIRMQAFVRGCQQRKRFGRLWLAWWTNQLALSVAQGVEATKIQCLVRCRQARRRVARLRVELPASIHLQRMARGFLARREAARRRAAVKDLSANAFATYTTVREVVEAAQATADAHFAPGSEMAGMPAQTLLLRLGLSHALAALKRRGVGSTAQLQQLSQVKNGLRFLGKEESGLVKRLLRGNSAAKALFRRITRAKEVEALFLEAYPKESRRRAATFAARSGAGKSRLLSVGRLQEYFLMHRARGSEALAQAQWLSRGPGAEQCEGQEETRRLAALRQWREATRRLGQLMGGVRFPISLEEGSGREHAHLLHLVHLADAAERSGGAESALAVLRPGLCSLAARDRAAVRVQAWYRGAAVRRQYAVWRRAYLQRKAMEDYLEERRIRNAREFWEEEQLKGVATEAEELYARFRREHSYWHQRREGGEGEGEGGPVQASVIYEHAATGRRQRAPPEDEAYLHHLILRVSRRARRDARRATLLQARWRGHMARADLPRVREERRRGECATALQRCFRGFIGRRIAAKRAARVRRQRLDRAATTVQRRWRGVRGRRRAERKREGLERALLAPPLHHKAAYLLQTMGLGFLARVRVRRLREQRAMAREEAWTREVLAAQEEELARRREARELKEARKQMAKARRKAAAKAKGEEVVEGEGEGVPAAPTRPASKRSRRRSDARGARGRAQSARSRGSRLSASAVSEEGEGEGGEVEEDEGGDEEDLDIPDPVRARLLAMQPLMEGWRRVRMSDAPPLRHEPWETDEDYAEKVVDEVAAEEEETIKPRSFYWHTASGKTQWERPVRWEAARTADGQLYYYDTETGDVQWERPATAGSDPMGEAVMEMDGWLCPWKQITPGVGKPYYVHLVTSEVRWKRLGRKEEMEEETARREAEAEKKRARLEAARRRYIASLRGVDLSALVQERLARRDRERERRHALFYEAKDKADLGMNLTEAEWNALDAGLLSEGEEEEEDGGGGGRSDGATSQSEEEEQGEEGEGAGGGLGFDDAVAAEDEGRDAFAEARAKADAAKNAKAAAEAEAEAEELANRPPYWGEEALAKRRGRPRPRRRRATVDGDVVTVVGSEYGSDMSEGDVSRCGTHPDAKTHSVYSLPPSLAPADEAAEAGTAAGGEDETEAAAAGAGEGDEGAAAEGEETEAKEKEEGEVEAEAAEAEAAQPSARQRQGDKAEGAGVKDLASLLLLDPLDSDPFPAAPGRVKLELVCSACQRQRATRECPACGGGGHFGPMDLIPAEELEAAGGGGSRGSSGATTPVKAAAAATGGGALGDLLRAKQKRQLQGRVGLGDPAPAPARTSSIRVAHAGDNGVLRVEVGEGAGEGAGSERQPSPQRTGSRRKAPSRMRGAGPRPYPIQPAPRTPLEEIASAAQEQRGAGKEGQGAKSANVRHWGVPSGQDPTGLRCVPNSALRPLLLQRSGAVNEASGSEAQARDPLEEVREAGDPARPHGVKGGVLLCDDCWSERHMCVQCGDRLATRHCVECTASMARGKGGLSRGVFCDTCHVRFHAKQAAPERQGHSFTRDPVRHADYVSFPAGTPACVECWPEMVRATRQCDECGEHYCTGCFVRTHLHGRRRSHPWRPLFSAPDAPTRLRVANAASAKWMQQQARRGGGAGSAVGSAVGSAASATGASSARSGSSLGGGTEADTGSLAAPIVPDLLPGSKLLKQRRMVLRWAPPDVMGGLPVQRYHVLFRLVEEEEEDRRWRELKEEQDRAAQRHRQERSEGGKVSPAPRRSSAARPATPGAAASPTPASPAPSGPARAAAPQAQQPSVSAPGSAAASAAGRTKPTAEGSTPSSPAPSGPSAGSGGGSAAGSRAGEEGRRGGDAAAKRAARARKRARRLKTRSLGGEAAEALQRQQEKEAEGRGFRRVVVRSRKRAVAAMKRANELRKRLVRPGGEEEGKGGEEKKKEEEEGEDQGEEDRTFRPWGASGQAKKKRYRREGVMGAVDLLRDLGGRTWEEAEEERQKQETAAAARASLEERRAKARASVEPRPKEYVFGHDPQDVRRAFAEVEQRRREAEELLRAAKQSRALSRSLEGVSGQMGRRFELELEAIQREADAEDAAKAAEAASEAAERARKHAFSIVQRPTECSFSKAGLEPGRYYEVKLSAVTTGGESTYSQTMLVRTPGARPLKTGEEEEGEEEEGENGSTRQGQGEVATPDGGGKLGGLLSRAKAMEGSLSAARSRGARSLAQVKQAASAAAGAARGGVGAASTGEGADAAAGKEEEEEAARRRREEEAEMRRRARALQESKAQVHGMLWKAAWRRVSGATLRRTRELLAQAETEKRRDKLRRRLAALREPPPPPPKEEADARTLRDRAARDAWYEKRVQEALDKLLRARK